MPPHWARRDPALTALINAGVPGWLGERPGWPGGKDNLADVVEQLTTQGLAYRRHPRSTLLYVRPHPGDLA